MSDHEELPSWSAGQARAEGPAAREPVPPRRGRGGMIVGALVGLLALIGMGYAGYQIAQNQSGDDTAATADPASPSTEDEAPVGSETADTAVDAEGSDMAAEGESESADDQAALDVTTDDAASGDEGGATEESDDDTAADDADDSGRTAVFRGGKLYLSGKVPSQEIADLIVEKAKAVVGPDNVEADYEIDPTVVIDPGESTPLYVEDVVLFRFNSVEIDPPFLPLLDLGTLLLSQNPQATLTVVTRTDAVGSEEVNLEVARQRAQALIDYWLSKGVNPDQIKADPRGEELASEDDDEQAAALQRRAEFIITGLLD